MQLIRQGAGDRRRCLWGSPIIYDAAEEFPIGGCKVLRDGDDDQATVVAAGVTLHEALAAQ